MEAGTGWGRDDEPIEFDELRPDPTSKGAPDATRPARGGARTVVAIAAAAALLSATVAVVGRDPGGSEATPTVPAPSVTPMVTAPELTSAETTTSVRPHGSVLRFDGSGRQVRACEPPLVGAQPQLVVVADGQVPTWTEWWVEVPDALVEMDPVELVLVARSALHRVRLPAGRVQSVAIEANFDGTTQVGRLADAGVIYSMRDRVWVLVDGRPATTAPVGPYPELFSHVTGDVVVRTAGMWSSNGADHPPTMWLVGEDGAIVDIASTDRPVWGPGFNVLGEMVADAPGGVYAIDLTTGGSRRLTDGELVVLGTREAIVERCDALLRCEFAMIDTATGETWAVDLGGIDPRELLPPRRLSPDGTKLLGFHRGEPVGWLVLDTTTGEVTLLGRADAPIGPQAHPIGPIGHRETADGSWLPGSDGVVMAAEDGLVVVRPDEPLHVINGLSGQFADIVIVPD